MKATRHIPKSGTNLIDTLSFKDALKEALEPTDAYDVEKWLYVPNKYDEYRYILGTRGQNPLIVIGANPSTASPERLDPTLRSAERIAAYNGYDSFLMLNVYPQRATDPKLVEKEGNEFLMHENVRALEYSLSLSPTKNVWCAWGNVIEGRPYMKKGARDEIAAGEKLGANWLCAGPPLKSGNPHHPLYLKTQTKLMPFEPGSIFGGCRNVSAGQGMSGTNLQGARLFCFI